MLNFIGIGAQKCGTTWLYEMLRQHPQIEFPSGKEIHFWDDFRSRGIDWYRNLFLGEEKLKGEITPAYATLPSDVIAEVQREFPELRLIFIMRNPIERAWSAAKMMLARAEMSIDEASDQWFIDLFRSRGSLSRGDYETCLRTWLTHFHRDQILVLRYEKIQNDPINLLSDCCNFIGLKNYKNFLPDNSAERIFPTAQLSIRPSLEAALKDLYTQKIQSLSLFLEEDLSDWL